MVTKNDVKYYASLKQKKYRQQEGKFLIEGFHLIEECLGSSYVIECVLVSDSTGIDKSNKIFGRLEKKNIPVHYLKENLFAKVAETDNSQGIAAVVLKGKLINTDSLYKSKLIVALDRIKDPGNLGTIIRTAYWFGADAVRSTQGGVFHVDVIENLPLEKTLDDLNSNGFNIYLLDVEAQRILGEFEDKKKTVFVFGSEAEGISKNILNKGYESIKIEGYSFCESLNVAVSCGIVLQNFRNKNKG